MGSLLPLADGGAVWPAELEEDVSMAGQRLDLETKMRSLLHIEQRLR